MTFVFDRYDNRLSIKATEKEWRGYCGSKLAAYQIHENQQAPNYRKFF